MFVATQRINTLIKTIIYQTTKSRRTTTPTPFNKSELTPLGILRKPQRSYNYDLPDNLPNRHLYWNRSVQNRELRLKYNQRKLQRLKIKPIHQQGKRVSREPIELSRELTSIKIIKQSVGRTLANIHQAITRYPQQYLANGKESDILKYAINQVHDRHLTTMNFYKFSSYCQLRYMANIEPTQTLLLHFFRHIEAARHNKNNKLTLQRLAQLSNYIFSRQYPQSINILHKKPIKFELFGQGQQTFTTLQDIVPKLFSPQQLKDIRKNINDKKYQGYLKVITKMPGGNKLVQNINSTAL